MSCGEEMDALHSLKRLYGEDEASTGGVDSSRKKRAPNSMKQVFFGVFQTEEVAICSVDLQLHLEQEGKSKFIGSCEECSLRPEDTWKQVVLGKGYDDEKVEDKNARGSTFHVAGQSVDEATSMFKYSGYHTPTIKLVRKWSKHEWKLNLMQWWMYRNLYKVAMGGSVGATRK